MNSCYYLISINLVSIWVGGEGGVGVGGLRDGDSGF